MRLVFFATFLGLICASSAAFAATDRMSGTFPKSDISRNAQEAEPNAEEADRAEPAAGPSAAEVVDVAKSVRRIESLGTLATFRQGSLGPDIWTGTRRSAILALVPQTPAATGSTTVTDLIRRAMLTEAGTGGIKNDAPVAPGQDFLTLRLEHLLRQGAYQDALDLYSLVRDKPYTPRLGKAGISAMLLTSNGALACLEARAIELKPQEDPFWVQLDAWCAHIADKAGEKGTTKAPPASAELSFSKILGAVANDKGWRFPLRDLREIEKLSVIERTALVSESRIDYAGIQDIASADIAPDCLTLPLYDSRVPESLRLRLAAEGVRRGLLPVQYLVKIYRDIAPPNAPVPQTDPQNPASAVRVVPFLFRTADRNPKDSERWAAIEAAMSLRPVIGWAPLLPFAEIARDMSPGTVAPGVAERVAEIVMRAGYTLPSSWVARIGEKGGKSAEKNALRHLAALIAAEDNDAAEFLFSLSKSVSPRTAQTLLAISEGLGAEKNGDSGKKEPYVNVLPLTGAEDYVMPSFEVLDDLEGSVESKTPGDVVLLSALAMGEAEPEKAYPGTLRKILAGYRSVGLHHEARKLAVEAILGLAN